MKPQESHLSDQELLLAADGELPSGRAAQVARHVSACWTCRARKQELEEAICGFVRLHHDHLDPLLPPAEGPRALLKAHLAELAAVPRPWWNRWSQVPDWRQTVTVLFVATAMAAWYHYGRPVSELRPDLRGVPVSFPEPSLTPGAVVSIDRQQICSSPRPKNRVVSIALQRKVFEEYGIPSAEPRAYEVDYLITPALGGADDIHNLWPQSYSSAVWNARVKDALEDRLHDLVCEGKLDLVTAQHDLSSDWIAAYQKYFHSDKPVETAPQN